MSRPSGDTVPDGRLTMICNIGNLFGIVVSGLHVVRSHGNRESPVDERQRGKERCHLHVADPSGLDKEETDHQHQHTVDKIEPPIAAVTSRNRRHQLADAPVDENEGNEIREYSLRQDHTSDKHEAYEQVNGEK